jgi:hypothetical protein
MNGDGKTASVTSLSQVISDYYPRPGERIKQYVVDGRKLREREVATCPKVDVPKHLNNCEDECGGYPKVWVDIETAHSCGTCSDLADATRDRPDVAAWRADRGTWPKPCADHSQLSSEVAEDLSLRRHPTIGAVRRKP